MNPTLSKQLIETIRANLKKKDSSEGAEFKFPSTDYTDKALFDRELEMIFLKHPIILGHVSQLKQSGDFVVQNVCGKSILITRNERAEIKAFLNVCRHRGASVVTEPSGSGQKNFSCRYHGWTYNADGKLTHIPSKDTAFPKVDCDHMGLKPLSTEVKFGLIWVQLSPAPEVSIATSLGDLSPELETFKIDEYLVYKTETFKVSFNWKLGVELSLETYHFDKLHRSSIADIYLANSYLLSKFGKHSRFVEPKKSITKEQLNDHSNIREVCTLNYQLFPNSCLFVEKHHFSLLQVFPNNVGESTIVISHLVKSLDHAREAEFWDKQIKIFNSAILEDFEVCESCQQGFASGASEHFIFGRNEEGCIHFHKTVNSMTTC